MSQHERLPTDHELEQAYIAGIIELADHAAAYRLICETPDGMFFDPFHRELWASVVALATAAKAGPDMVTVASEVRRMERQGEATKQAAFLRLLKCRYSANPQEIAAQGRKLANLAWYRGQATLYASASQNALQMAFPPEQIDSLMEVERKTMLHAYGASAEVTGADAAARLAEYRAGLCGDSRRLVWTGIRAMDQHGGIPPEYVLLLARSSVGKTGLALSLARNILHNCGRDKRHILYWSGEQQVSMIAAKLVSQISGASAGEVLGVHPAEPAMQQWIDAIEQAMTSSQHLHILDGRKSVEQIWAYAARLRDKHGLSAVFIDQFDKLAHAGRRGANREEVWSETSARIFAAMQDTGCAWFVLAQLGIKNQKEHPKPSAWHIRDCSQLIQDCDRAYVIDRPEAEPERWEAMKLKAPEEARAMHNAARITLEKNRNGIGGLWSEVVPFSRHCGRFGDLTPDDAREKQPEDVAEWVESTPTNPNDVF